MDGLKLSGKYFKHFQDKKKKMKSNTEGTKKFFLGGSLEN